MKKNKYIYNLIILLIVIVGLLISSNISSKNNENNIIELNPSIINWERGHHNKIDPEQKVFLQVDNIIASDTLVDNSGIDFSIQNIISFDKWDNSWCVHGNGKGIWFKVYPIDRIGYPDPPETLYDIFRIKIINGLLFESSPKKEYLYYLNNRIKKIKLELSEGDLIILNLEDKRLDFQVFKIGSIKTKWIKFTILETYKGNKYNDTCLAKIMFEQNKTYGPN